MSQGPRRGWLRTLLTGLGVVLCTGLVGCMNSDKDKNQQRFGTNTRQTTTGLPGTRPLPGQAGSGGVGLQNPSFNGGTTSSIGTGGQPNRAFGTQGMGNTVPAQGLGLGSNAVVPSVGPGGGQYVPVSGSNFGSGMPQSPQSPAGNMSSGSAYPRGTGYLNDPAAPALTNPGLAPPVPRGSSMSGSDVVAPVSNGYRGN